MTRSTMLALKLRGGSLTLYFFFLANSILKLQNEMNRALGHFCAHTG